MSHYGVKEYLQVMGFFEQLCHHFLEILAIPLNTPSDLIIVEGPFGCTGVKPHIALPSQIEVPECSRKFDHDYIIRSAFETPQPPTSTF